MPADIPQSVLGTELPRGMIRRTVSVDTEHVGKMLHKGTRDDFTVMCDEPERMGGGNEYPAPLTYIAMGIGF